MDLIVPVYLNQNLVFDLVAMSQGGIATVTKVTESISKSDNTSTDASASFGLSDAFASLLKIGLSASEKTDSEKEVSEDRTEERVHTPNSLFFILRNWLSKEGKLKDYEGGLPVPGDFIEFEASLRRSPMIVGLDAVTKIMELSEVFNPPDQTRKPKGQKSKPSEMAILAKQLGSLSDSLKEGGSRDLIADDITAEYQAVLTVEEKYLNDITMSDIVDGKFKVLGKVVRAVESNEGSISLLRKTPLEHTPEIMQQLLKAFQDLDEGVFTMPEMQTEVEGPVIQVLPIAIYS